MFVQGLEQRSHGRLDVEHHDPNSSTLCWIYYSKVNTEILDLSRKQSRLEEIIFVIIVQNVL